MVKLPLQQPVNLQKDEDKEIWFPAKKYGNGWGLPITWQRWIAF